MSVPAHQSKWSATDVGVGHFRRYERAGFRDLLERAGLEVCELEIYGFPLANIIAPLQSLRYRRKLATQQVRGAEDPGGRVANTAQSGVSRSTECKLYPYYSSYLGLVALRASCRIQAWFRETELGNG